MRYNYSRLITDGHVEFAVNELVSVGYKKVDFKKMTELEIRKFMAEHEKNDVIIESRTDGMKWLIRVARNELLYYDNMPYNAYYTEG